MALTKLYTDWAVRFHALTAQAAAAVYIQGARDVILNSQLRTRVEGGDGAVYATFGSLVAGAPAARFSTQDLKKFFDECGNEGMQIDADGTHPGLSLWWQKFKEGGTREAIGSSLHGEATIANGLIVPRSLDLTHQGPAVLTAEAFARQNGAVAPVVFDETADLPTGTLSGIDTEFTLGRLDLGALDLDGLESASIDFGIDVAVEGRDSDIYPSVTTIGSIRPSITAACSHVDLTSELTEDGKFYAASTVALYARKRSEGGTFVSDVTAEHIKFTLGKCRVEWEQIGGDPKSMGVRITPWYTGGVSPVFPITIDTASAIT